MRYLKIYEEFEPSSSLKEDIKDIFIDLTDNYLDVQVSDSFFNSEIVISKPNEGATNLTDYDFNIDSDIIESILRLNDYLESNKLYLNHIIIKKLRLARVDGLSRWVEDDLNVTNITEEGLFIYESKLIKLFTDPAHKIVIKYSDKKL